MMKIYFENVNKYVKLLEPIIQAGVGINGVVVNHYTLGNDVMPQVKEWKGKTDIIGRCGLDEFMLERKREKAMDYFLSFIEWVKLNGEVLDFILFPDVWSFFKEQTWDYLEETLKFDNVVVTLPENVDDAMLDELIKRKVKFVAVDWDNKKSWTVNKEARFAIGTMQQHGMKVWVTNYSRQDIIRMKNMDAMTTDAWRYATQYGKIWFLKNKYLSQYEIADNPIIINQIVKSPIWQNYAVNVVERQVSEKNYVMLDVWNAVAYSWWREKQLDKTPAYEKAIVETQKDGASLPEWAEDYDKTGRRKVVYLKSRFNSFKHGGYAKVVSEMALQCNNCAVRDVCPMFEPDSVCAFIPMWKKLGIKTRNKDAVLTNVENIVADMLARHERAKFMELAAGGLPERTVTNLEINLLKAMELYHRMLYGDSGSKVNIFNMGETKAIIGANMEEELKKIRDEYGDEMASKVTERIKKIGNDDDGTGTSGDT